MSRPLVLLSNDDGYNSAGILALLAAIESFVDAIVVAPLTEQSAMSHALTLTRPLRIKPIGAKTFAIDGTPADCVYLALHAGSRFLPRKPDLVLSGINYGENLGQDVFYSGTVAAAREGALRGIPSVAISADRRADLSRIASFVAGALPKWIKRRATLPLLLNMNVPEPWTGAIAHTRPGSRVYEDVVDLRVDPRGGEYAWIGGPPKPFEGDPGTDVAANAIGIASLSALDLDLLEKSDGSRMDELVHSMRA